MVDDGDHEWLETNRRLWNEMASIHPSTALYDIEGLVAGRDDLRPWEDEELGPVSGLDLVHLQCHIGSDTIAWARRGARVVGLDFSDEAIAVARDVSTRCGLDVEWVQANVYDAVTALGGRTFDVVYTGVGALGWLPDLARWAEVVHTVEREMAVRLGDVLIRRLHLFYEDASHGSVVAAPVATRMAGLLDWDEARRDAEVASYAAEVKRAREFLKEVPRASQEVF